MAFCVATKPDGVGCEARAITGSEWCFDRWPDCWKEHRLGKLAGDHTRLQILGDARATSVAEETRVITVEIRSRPTPAWHEFSCGCNLTGIGRDPVGEAG